MVDYNLMLCLYIPMFLVILTLFMLIVAFEVKCLWSSAGIYFDQHRIFYQFQPGQTTPWTVLVIIQAIWGLTFIKLACTYSIYS